MGPLHPVWRPDPWRSDGVLRMLATSASSLRPQEAHIQGKVAHWKMQRDENAVLLGEGLSTCDLAHPAGLGKVMKPAKVRT